MAETYSPSLKITLIGAGDLSGTWGDTTNTNLGTLIEQAITGVLTVPMGDANVTLTNLNGISDQARNAVIIATGAATAIRQIIIPQANKLYVISNQTTGGYAITIGTSIGTLVSVPNGVTAQVYTDGTNTFSSQTGSAGNFVVNGTLSATGIADTGALTSATLSVSGLASFPGGVSSTSTATFSGISSFTNTVTAPTAATSDASTLVATTALVTNKINAITSVPAANQLNTGSGWKIYQSGSKLFFVYNNVAVASIDSSGNIISAANVTAYGTP
jgi:hypothetical protein